MQRMRSRRDRAMIGPLGRWLVRTEWYTCRGEEVTDFMKNIHLQVVLSAITPPRMGPRRFAMAKTELMTPE
jgi:hypothetical protein